jgi:two-component system nitrogen regulation response regulator NtrX
VSTILVVDDEPGIRTVLQDILTDEGYEVLLAEDGLEGLATVKRETVDLVLLDVWLPKMGGIDVLKEVKKEFPDLEVILISGHANIDLAVKAVKMGAFDFVEKPLSLDKILTLIRNALQMESLKKENQSLRSSLFLEDDMVGDCAAMTGVQERIAQSAASEAKILILGENGTGKELVARRIHMGSERKNGPFVEVNCAAIPDTLIESELFGHEKGAFTGAVARRKGKFELAHGGTLFLDEIADLSLSAQAKVLRAVQEMRFERVGGEKTIEVDVRVIAATNKDIPGEIAAGRFREDLYFRLNVIPITVPPLRDREGDLQRLVEYFLGKFSSDGEPRALANEAMELLAHHAWPGNVRELKNFVERITVMSDEPTISRETVAFYLVQKEAPGDAGLFEEFGDMKLNEAKDKFERDLLIHKLEEHGYNVSQTAQSLGIYPSNLHGKIKKFGIDTKK